MLRIRLETKSARRKGADHAIAAQDHAITDQSIDRLYFRLTTKQYE